MPTKLKHLRARDGARYRDDGGTYTRVDPDARLKQQMRADGLSPRQQRKLRKALRREAKRMA